MNSDSSSGSDSSSHSVVMDDPPPLRVPLFPSSDEEETNDNADSSDEDRFKNCIPGDEWEKKLNNIVINKEDIDTLVMDFLISEDLVEAAAAFGQESVSKGQMTAPEVNQGKDLTLPHCLKMLAWEEEKLEEKTTYPQLSNNLLGFEEG